MRRPAGAADAVADRELGRDGGCRIDRDGDVALGRTGSAGLRLRPFQRRDLGIDIAGAGADAAQFFMDLDQRGADRIEHGRPIGDGKGLAIGAKLVGADLGEALDGGALGLDRSGAAGQRVLFLAQRLELTLDHGVEHGAGLAGRETDIDRTDREGAAARSFGKTPALDADRGRVDGRRQAAQHDLRGALQQFRPAEPRHDGAVRINGDAIDARGQLGFGCAGEAGCENQSGGKSGHHTVLSPQTVTRP